MAADFKPHVKLNTDKQKDKPIKLKFIKEPTSLNRMMSAVVKSLNSLM